MSPPDLTHLVSSCTSPLTHAWKWRAGSFLLKGCGFSRSEAGGLSAMSKLEYAALVAVVADRVSFGEVIGNSSSSSHALAEPELQQLETLLNIATTLVAMHMCARARAYGKCHKARRRLGYLSRCVWRLKGVDTQG